MDQLTPVETGMRSLEMNPYQTLHLLPSAPRDLIVEVYWHLVHQLQVAAREDLSLRPRLDELNQAYSQLVDPDARGENEADPADSHELQDQEATAPPRTDIALSRLWKRGVSPRPRPVSPWEILHLHPQAPPDVVELAYSFWRLSLRGQLGKSAAAELEKLQEAHQTLRSGRSEPAAEPCLVAEPDAAKAGPQAAEIANRPSAEPVADTGAVDVKETSDRRLARQAGNGIGPWAALSRWAGATGGALWERLRGFWTSGASDPTPWFPVGTPEATTGALDAPRDFPGAAPGSSPEDSLAAASNGGLPKARLAEAALAEHAIETPAEEATPREASDPPPADPHLTLPPRSETILPVPSSQLAQLSGASAHLVAESGLAKGVRAAIGPDPLSIGTDPTCDLLLTETIADGKYVAARIWLQEDRFMFHGIGSTPTVLVNGQAMVWALLEDGDKLEIGDEVFRFQRTVPQTEEVRTESG